MDFLHIIGFFYQIPLPLVRIYSASIQPLGRFYFALCRRYSVAASRKETVPRVASSSALTPMGIVIWG